MDEVKKKQLEALLRHIALVRENCELLGNRLIEKGEEQLGLSLIANGMIHDSSKLTGVEWEFLHAEAKEKQPEMFKIASDHHVKTNLHHPEAWPNGIRSMDRLHIAECVSDWRSRAMEMGDDIWEWVTKKAAKRYGYTTRSTIYKDIKEMLELVLEPKFK